MFFGFNFFVELAHQGLSGHRNGDPKALVGRSAMTNGGLTLQLLFTCTNADASTFWKRLKTTPALMECLN
jgi:hypothetical protein